MMRNVGEVPEVTSPPRERPGARQHVTWGRDAYVIQMEDEGSFIVYGVTTCASGRRSESHPYGSSMCIS